MDKRRQNKEDRQEEDEEEKKNVKSPRATKTEAQTMEILIS